MRLVYRHRAQDWCTWLVSSKLRARTVTFGLHISGIRSCLHCILFNKVFTHKNCALWNKTTHPI
jgi:hypothetical protein